MGRDITESNKAEQKLKESEEKYRDLLNNIHEAIVELDENGNVEYMSPQVFKLTGYLPEEQIGINLRELIHPDDLELVLITFNKLMQSGEIQSMDFRRKHKDGHYIYVNSSGRRVKIGDKYKIIGITKDITDRQRAEEKFQVLFKNSTSGIAYHKLIYDSEGKPIDYIITEVNPQFEAILPFKREDVINKRATEAYGVDIAPYLEIFSKVAETQESTAFETFFPPINMYFNISVISSRKGEFITVFDNISERKEIEQDLRDSEEKYRMLFEGSNDAIFLLDHHTVIDTNDYILKFFGYDEKREIIGLTPWDLSPIKQPDGRNSKEKARELNDKCLEGESQRFYWKHSRKDGTLFDVEVSLNRILIEDRYYIQAINRDITERKIAEKKLKESEERYRILFEFSPVGIGISDLEGNIYSINQAMEEITGYNSESAKDTNLKSIYTDPDDHLKLLKKLKEAGSVQDYLVKFRKKDGSVYDALLNIEAITIANKNFFITNVQDISERKKAEKKLKELSKLKSELLTRTPHELKTPAMHIKGYADLLLHKHKNELGAEELQIISHIKKGVLRLETLIYDILHKAELDAGYGELNRIQNDLSSLIDLNVKELRSFAALRGHSIILDIHDTMKINFDKEQIRHVINNLITNAIKYTPLNGIIGIDSTITDDFITIAIKDNGIGLTEEQIDRLFTQFGKIERYGQGFDIITEGSGLGLHIAKKIIDLHSGRIWVESGGRNKGSTFYFSLPKVNI